MHRHTILTPATVTGLALFALTVLAGEAPLGTRALAQSAPPTQNRPQAQGTPASTQPQAQGQRPAAPPVAGTAGGRGAAQVGRSRRPSFAACNRVSHARGLRGGARRRFLVRCKLGYDRPRSGQPQSQTAPARQP